jgi:soluble lytic murein transglycosylase-like protein
VAAQSTVVLPEITAIALAREVLAVEAGRRLSEEQREQVARVLADAEQSLEVEVLLVLALITQESRFDPRAVGPAGSLGLMQIRPWVGRDIAMRYGLPWKGDESLFEPAYNVRLGTYYFAEMMEMFGEPELALAAYNMGPYRVRRLLRQGRYGLHPAFVHRVFGHYDALFDRFRRSETGWGG